VRVYELARDLGVDSKDLLQQAQDLGIEVKTASSGLDDESAELLRLAVAGDAAEVTEEAEPEVEAEEAVAATEPEPEANLSSTSSPSPQVRASPFSPRRSASPPRKWWAVCSKWASRWEPPRPCPPS
jgi:translation initiation factor IF-2